MHINRNLPFDIFQIIDLGLLHQIGLSQVSYKLLCLLFFHYKIKRRGMWIHVIQIPCYIVHLKKIKKVLNFFQTQIMNRCINTGQQANRNAFESTPYVLCVISDLTIFIQTCSIVLKQFMIPGVLFVQTFLKHNLSFSCLPSNKWFTAR